MVVHWDPDKSDAVEAADAADTAADDSDPADSVVDCILAEGIGLEHYDRNPEEVHRYIIRQCRRRTEDSGEPTNTPYDPVGCLRHRRHIGHLADRAESLHVAEVHTDSPGLEAHSHLGHPHIEEPETGTLVVRKVAGHKVAAGHSPGTDRDAGPDEGWETELRSLEEVDCRDSTWLISGRRTTEWNEWCGLVWCGLVVSDGRRVDDRDG